MEQWKARSPEQPALSTAAESCRKLLSLPAAEVLVPVSPYGCNMYMTIHGSSFYNRLLAGECDSRWLSSNWATGWYESANEYLLVQTNIFFLELCVLLLAPLQVEKKKS